MVIGVFPLTPLTRAQTQQAAVSLSPSSYTANQVNETFAVNVTISNVQGLWGWSASVLWDPQCLSLLTSKVSEGDFLTDQAGSTFWLPAINGTGQYDLADASSSVNTATGSGVLVTLEFQVTNRFLKTTINLSDITLLGPTNPNATTESPNPPIAVASNSSTMSVSLNTGGAPTANAGVNQIVQAGTNVVLNGSASISEGANPTYTWTFVDVTQQTLTGIIANYTFNNSGTFVVTLTVQDSLGSDQSTLQVTVVNGTLPTITMSGGTSGKALVVGQTITFGVDNSAIQGTTVQNFTWGWSDGTPLVVTVDLTATHSFSNAGTFAVNVTIFYADGLVDVANTTIQIVPVSSNPGSSPSPGSSSIPGSSSRYRRHTKHRVADTSESNFSAPSTDNSGDYYSCYYLCFRRIRFLA